jgi:hypothetical protein
VLESNQSGLIDNEGFWYAVDAKVNAHLPLQVDNG